MKISLSVQALERLLGDDSEIEIELRQQVVSEFTKKHLKGIVNTEAWRSVVNQWTADIQGLVDSHMKAFIADRQAKTPAMIKDSVEWSMGKLLREEVTKYLQEFLKKPNIIPGESWIETQVVYQVKQAIFREMEKIIATEVVTNDKINAEINKQVSVEISRRLKIAEEAASNSLKKVEK